MSPHDEINRNYRAWPWRWVRWRLEKTAEAHRLREGGSIRPVSIRGRGLAVQEALLSRLDAIVEELRGLRRDLREHRRSGDLDA